MSWNRRTRNRAAWMWLAIAAVTFTSVATAETGRQTSRGYAHPVFEFLVRSHSQSSAAHSAPSRFTNSGSHRQASSIFRGNAAGPLIAFLPVLFIGLVSPLRPLSAPSADPLGRAPATPLLSALFQRPPPALA
ncbi:hypothetical protein [Occallatibacter savannae]|uniref:hypothetical protein n=1 Tax=Occallatibacter savannae TaxID=1002691 RepID=UPI000D68F9C2|nr:hypothetical protein [Occallatibacter savannae]